MAAVPLSYAWRSLLRRPMVLVLTTAGVSVAVAVLVAMLAMVQGLNRTLAGSGDPRNVVVLSRGALAESTSAIPRDAYRVFQTNPAVVASSPEAVVVWTVHDAQEQMRMVPFRGITEASFGIHGARVVQGRAPGPGEAIVGRALHGSVPVAAMGQSFQWGRRKWTVVGVFETGGTAFESEIWGEVEAVLDDDRRETYSAATLRVADASFVPALVRALQSDTRFAVRARPEPEYYEAQSGSSAPIVALALLVAVLMGVASIFGAVNTMQASLSARRSEVALLRALGFPDASVVASFLVESLLLTIPAGVVGCLLAGLVDGRELSMMNMLSFGSVGFQMTVTPGVVAAGMAYAALIGALGGVWPAISASRIPLAQAMRG